MSGERPRSRYSEGYDQGESSTRRESSGSRYDSAGASSSEYSRSSRDYDTSGSYYNDGRIPYRNTARIDVGRASYEDANYMGYGNKGYGDTRRGRYSDTGYGDAGRTSYSDASYDDTRRTSYSDADYGDSRRSSYSDASYQERRRERAYEDGQTRQRSRTSSQDQTRSRSRTSSQDQERRRSRSSSQDQTRSRSRSTSQGTSRRSETQGSRRSSTSRDSSRRTSSQDSARSRSRSSQTSRSGFSGVSITNLGANAIRRFNWKYIAVGVAAIVLLVFIGFGVSRCMHQDSSSSSQASSAAQPAQASSQSASAASSESQSSSAQTTASTTSSQGSSATSGGAATTSATYIAAEPGDVSYLVAEGARLAKRNFDFAVDPNRTDWNYTKTNGHKTIYLTFDDGPSENTEAALDILDKYNCKATFFVTGQNPKYYSWIKEAYDRGHTIGLHSMSHEYGQIYLSADEFYADLDAIGQLVKSQIGYVPCFIRFPGGASNTISAEASEGIMTLLTQDVLTRGYQYYDWSYSCGDGSTLTTQETIEAGCEEPDEDNIIYLLHDGAGKETTIEALPTIIEFYQQRGYTFEAIDRNTLVYHHEPQN